MIAWTSRASCSGESNCDGAAGACRSRAGPRSGRCSPRGAAGRGRRRRTTRPSRRSGPGRRRRSSPAPTAPSAPACAASVGKKCTTICVPSNDVIVASSADAGGAHDEHGERRRRAGWAETPHREVCYPFRRIMRGLPRHPAASWPLAAPASAALPAHHRRARRRPRDRRRRRARGPAARHQRQPARRLLPGRPEAADDVPARPSEDFAQIARARLQRRPARDELVGVAAASAARSTRPTSRRVRAAVDDAAAARPLHGASTCTRTRGASSSPRRPATACPPGLGPAVGLGRRAGVGDAHRRADDLPRGRHARALARGRAGVPDASTSTARASSPSSSRRGAGSPRAFAGDARVAGYDLLNEPHPGFLIGAEPERRARALLRRARSTRSARASSAGGGFEHVVFFEPSVLWSGFGDDAVPPPGFTDDERIVFAPHLYAESITVDQKLGINSVTIERGFDERRARPPRSYGAPLWSGEWGWFGEPAKELPEARALRPRGGPRRDRRRVLGVEAGVRRPAHRRLQRRRRGAQPPPVPRRPAARPEHDVHRRCSAARTRASRPGRITALRADGGDVHASRGAPRATGSCRLEVWVPGDREPELTARNVADLAHRSGVPGGWLATGCAGPGAYELSRPPRRAPRPAPPPPGVASAVPQPPRHRRQRPRPRRVGCARSASARNARSVGAATTRASSSTRGRPRPRRRLDHRDRRDGTRYSERRAYRTCVRR